MAINKISFFNSNELVVVIRAIELNHTMTLAKRIQYLWTTQYILEYVFARFPHKFAGIAEFIGDSQECR